MNQISSSFFLLISVALVAAAYGQTASTTATFSESASYSPRVFPVDPKKKEKKEKYKEKEKEPKGQRQTPPDHNAQDSTIMIPVAVFTSQGKFLTGLKAPDFKAFIDEKEVEIVSVETKNDPLNVILVLDMSPSAETQKETVRNAALRIVQSLLPGDKVMVVGFSSSAKIATDLTDDRKKTENAIKSLRTGDGTALYNTISELIETRLKGISGPTEMILVTDGVDTVSRKASYESSLIATEKGNVVVFPIFFDTFDESIKAANKMVAQFPVLGGIHLISTSKEEYDTGRDYLTDLVLISGGRPMLGKDILPDRAHLLDGISTEMRNRYHVTFRLKDAEKPSERHRIKIRISEPNLRVFAKGSYIEK